MGGRGGGARKRVTISHGSDQISYFHSRNGKIGERGREFLIDNSLLVGSTNFFFFFFHNENATYPFLL